MDNSEPLTKAYLDNIQKLEMLLKTQFELVSGFNIAEIRNKPVEERTDAEEQALADYEAYRVKEMEQMNRDIEKQIDNSPEKKEIDAAILANDVYGDDKEGYIYETNYKMLDLKSLSATDNPLKYVADLIDRCNNIDGIARKYIIRQGTGEHAHISKAGISNVGTDYLLELVRMHLLR